jgi:hypothetical protein
MIERRKMEEWTNLGYNTYVYGNIIMKHLYTYHKNVFFYKNEGEGCKTGLVRELVPVGERRT